MKSQAQNDTKMDLGMWNIPEFHANKIKLLYDDVMKQILETGTEKFEYHSENRIESYNEAVAELLTREYGDEVKSDHLFATYGAAFGFTLLLSHFFEKGDPAIFENFTFGCCAEVARAYGLDMKSVAHNEENDVNIQMLEKVMQESLKEKPFNKLKPWNGFLYLMAVCHNPKGTSLSEECCKSILEIARKYNYLVICDDVYNIYDFTAPKKHRILYFDQLTRKDNSPGHVISNGSLSKIVFPSFRMGYIEGAPWVIEQLASRQDLFSGGGFNILNQILAAGILKHPRFPDTLADLKDTYKELQTKACNFLKENLPDTASFRWPDGSFFVYVKLPHGFLAEDYVKMCEERKVIVKSGTNYSFDGKGGANYFRIAYTNVPEDKMFTALKILCDVMKELCTK